MMLAVVCVFVLAAIGIGWHAHTLARVSSDASGHTSASASPDSAESGGIDILLGLAKTAMNDHRLLAPAGSNAYEFYLSVLQLDPHNVIAQDSLRASFEEACNVVEHAIDTRELDEAQRELALLRDFDNSIYKLSLLGSKLSAQRALMTREHEAQAAIIQSAALEAQSMTNGSAH